MAPVAAAAILHADLDAFYASVEQLLDPSLRGKPMAVGGSVVLAASYEARSFGVQGGMSGWQAKQLCPGLLFVNGHFDRYQQLGDEVIAVLRDFTPLVERISIDEAFADVTGSVHLFGAPSVIASSVRRRVREEIGLAVSVGVARTKHLAKVASQVAKPDGLVIVEAHEERSFLDPLPVRLVWGVGPASQARLAEIGIQTIGDLARTSPSVLQHLLGRGAGTKLSSLAANHDERPVQQGRPARSVGAQSALGAREPTAALVRTTMAYLADRVGRRLRAGGSAGRTISVRVRFAGMRSVTRALTVPVAVSATLTLTELAVELVTTALAEHPRERHITLLAISVSNLVAEPALQLQLPLDLQGDAHRPGAPRGAARGALDRCMDAVRERFGGNAVGYASVALSDQTRVPEAFRELAQRHESSGATPPADRRARSGSG